MWMANANTNLKHFHCIESYTFLKASRVHKLEDKMTMEAKDNYESVIASYVEG